ncbi:MAG: hypothetical protein ONB07_11755, partial [candidate division KSB1 bacterium]|nr:hypothetical protein [candidate division KSB1 bacterium]
STERGGRSVGIGRKNWLFVQSVEAGQQAAVLRTLVESAALNFLDPLAYMTSLIEERLRGNEDYDALCTDVWATKHPQAIRRYRQAESEEAIERKAFRRALRRLARQGGGLPKVPELPEILKWLERPDPPDTS